MNKLLVIFPWLEVFIRVCYWRLPFLYRFANWLKGKLTSAKVKNLKRASLDYADLCISIKGLGIEKGDTLIVHSAFGEIKRFGVSPDEFLDFLIELVGPKGNLVMPAIPILKNQPSPIDRFELVNYSEVAVYDVQKSKAWTGALPQTLLRRQGAVRSRSPLNTMVVFGVDAESIVSNDLFCNDSLPCGQNSVLANCFERDAKILFLGVDEVHSMTMIHVAEDYFIDKWPVKNWFWQRPFIIRDKNYEQEMLLNERDPFWALFYAERRFSSDLFRAGILSKTTISDFSLSVCSSQKLISFLRSKNSKGYPYCIPFWYLKNSDK